MTHVITSACIGVKDASCLDVCPVECIYEGPEQFYIHPQECIDCGACISECPVDAIYMDEDLTVEQRADRIRNASYFNQSGQHKGR